MDTEERALKTYEAMDAAMDLAIDDADRQMLVDSFDKLLRLIQSDPARGMQLGFRWVRDQS